MSAHKIYPPESATIPILETGLNRWFDRYNTWRPHQALGNLTLNAVYQNRAQAPQQAVEVNHRLTA